MPRSVHDADAPLAATLRTALIVAVTKTAVSLVDVFVSLQAANGFAISRACTNAGPSGVQQFYHAAAVVLRRRQDAKMRKALFFSDMGDGSNDRKTIE